MLTSLFSLFYVTGEFHRFLHRGIRVQNVVSSCERLPGLLVVQDFFVKYASLQQLLPYLSLNKSNCINKTG